MDGKFYIDLIDNVGILEFSPEPIFTLTAVDGDDRGPCNRIVTCVSIHRLSMATQEQESA
ncbi:hypothetical protein E2562_018784 [Oryza meyeriana var. granulata]|uniref:Uncharacterized protein n=1 Tax=Oryza meyeriana var. granulata TaxID=110450 RepID=A0A6G1F9J0_9ORYZ|nr:hypothetical protein E2562_018784 [Oryza meyeriana var. granulata]